MFDKPTQRIDTPEQIFLFFFGKVCYTVPVYIYLF